MENLVERIVKLCNSKNIPIAKLEKDLGYGNGYLNPKKVSDMKTSRLIEILNYLNISLEEFFGVGSIEHQKHETELVHIKNAYKNEEINPEEYQLIDLYRRADDHDKNTVWQVLNRYTEDTSITDSKVG